MISTSLGNSIKIGTINNNGGSHFTLSERDKETVNTDKLDGSAHKTGYFLNFDLETPEILEKSGKSTTIFRYWKNLRTNLDATESTSETSARRGGHQNLAREHTSHYSMRTFH